MGRDIQTETGRCIETRYESRTDRNYGVQRIGMQMKGIC